MQEKEERNKKIFAEWQEGMAEYLKTGNRKEYHSYKQIGEKEGISATMVRLICLREIKRQNEKKN